MKPSRELNELIAIHVMNWPPIIHPLSRPIPLYSTNIHTSFAIDKPGWLWEFQEMPEALSVTLYTSFLLRRKAIEMYPVLPKGVILIREKWLDDKAQTYAWLRCLVALKAVSMEVDHD